MAQRPSRYVKVKVTFERRDDGGLRAYSDEVPGFVLSGSDAEAVFEDVIPALERLFSCNRGMDLKFAPLTDVRVAMEENGFLPAPEVRETREYAAPFEKIAA